MDKTKDFIEKAKLVHGDAYDYSKVNYINSHKKVCIICPKHGEFWQTPNNHLNGHGCYTCGKGKKNSESFIAEAKSVHGNKYDYSKTNYISANKKVIVTCIKHGDFFIRASSHLSGCGCKKCASEYIALLYKKNAETFISEAKSVHGNKYDYSKVNYASANKKVCIICPEHGEFWQTPNAHIKLFHGCPKCNNSRMHDFISLKLKENNVEFATEKCFEWLKYENSMRLDFFLPEYNLAIECQGGQHFSPVKRYGGNEGLKIRKERDFIKKQLCKENGINIVYVIPRRYKKEINSFIYNDENSFILEDENLIEKIIAKFKKINERRQGLFS